MTLDEVKKHIGKVWVDEFGEEVTLVAVYDAHPEPIVYETKGLERYSQALENWLALGNKPKEEKPKTVKVEFWRVIAGDSMKALYETDALFQSKEAAVENAGYNFCKITAIRKEGSDEIEIIKGEL